MENLMRPELLDTYGILKLQNCILNIAKYIDVFCQKHDIDYCLMGGSALGAVRHKGFIPWDDDLDIFMTPDNYELFRKCFKEEGDKEIYYLQEWGLDEKTGRITLAKLRMNQSFLIEKDLKDWNIHQGVYVDIFILHTCPDNKIKRYWQYIWAKYLVAKGAANRGYNKKSGLLQCAIKGLGKLPPRFLVNFALRQVYKFRNVQSQYQCHFLGRAKIKTGLYLRDYFCNTKKVPFETIELSVPYRVEDYLHDRWGNYMILPSKDEIEKFHHSWKWSESETFSCYNKQGSYPDERSLLS